MLCHPFPVLRLERSYEANLAFKQKETAGYVHKEVTPIPQSKDAGLVPGLFLCVTSGLIWTTNNYVVKIERAELLLLSVHGFAGTRELVISMGWCEAYPSGASLAYHLV